MRSELSVEEIIQQRPLKINMFFVLLDFFKVLRYSFPVYYASVRMTFKFKIFCGAPNLQEKFSVCGVV